MTWRRWSNNGIRLRTAHAGQGFVSYGLILALMILIVACAAILLIVIRPSLLVVLIVVVMIIGLGVLAGNYAKAISKYR